MIVICNVNQYLFILQDSRRQYEQAMQAYKPQKKKKDPNAPKQPLSAYFIFSSEERLKVKNEHPSYSICEVAKELGRYVITFGDACFQEISFLMANLVPIRISMLCP